jgi:hypothetical protein
LTGQSIWNRQGSELPADRQESALVQSASSIVLLAVATNTLGFLVFGAVALCLIISLVFLATGGSGSMYDQIGAGGISREGDHAGGAPTATPDTPTGRAEREREIRQMLSARSERLVRRGQPALDVDAELARLLAEEPATDTRDAGLVAEVRALVLARNERRIRQGLQPLDVDAEVGRTLDELDS